MQASSSAVSVQGLSFGLNDLKNKVQVTVTDFSDSEDVSTFAKTGKTRIDSGELNTISKLSNPH